MPFERWDLLKPDGTVLVANATSRRGAITRGLAYHQEFPGDVAGGLQDADESTPAGECIGHGGWHVMKHPYAVGRWEPG